MSHADKWDRQTLLEFQRSSGLTLRCWLRVDFLGHFLALHFVCTSVELVPEGLPTLDGDYLAHRKIQLNHRPVALCRIRVNYTYHNKVVAA